MNTPPHDAQRDMEQRALRNVRALVDKYEDKDEHDQKSVRNLSRASWWPSWLSRWSCSRFFAWRPRTSLPGR